MPRITVTASPDEQHTGETSQLLLDEHVASIHISNDHAATQFLKRLAWAISDAEELEHAV